MSYCIGFCQRIWIYPVQALRIWVSMNWKAIDYLMWKRTFEYKMTFTVLPCLTPSVRSTMKREQTMEHIDVKMYSFGRRCMGDRLKSQTSAVQKWLQLSRGVMPLKNSQLIVTGPQKRHLKGTTLLTEVSILWNVTSLENSEPKLECHWSRFLSLKTYLWNHFQRFKLKTHRSQ